MKAPVLTLRLSRRAIGAVVLADEELSFCDGRHLTSRRDRANLAATRYLERLLKLTSPVTVMFDSPRKEGSSTDALLAAVQARLKDAGVEFHVVGRSEERRVGKECRL